MNAIWVYLQDAMQDEYVRNRLKGLVCKTRARHMSCISSVRKMHTSPTEMILPDIYRTSPTGNGSRKRDQQPADASWSATVIPSAGKFQITSSQEPAANP